jgi:predicted small lipoprotein YifL
VSLLRFICVAAFAAFAFFVVGGCGKKGPPLPPLVKLPVAPENLTVARRGNTIDLQFRVPGTNTDGTRPANVSSADVYAITAPQDVVTPMTDQQLLKLATKVGSVPVKAPRNPNLTADADDPADEVDAPEGPGLEQGAVGRLEESLTEDALTPVEIPKDPNAPASGTDGDVARPLLGPPPNTVARIYAALGTSARGRKGPLSKRIVVPLVPPPPPPSAPKMTYDESAVTVTWPPVGDPAAVPLSTNGSKEDVLPSRPIGAPRPAITYNVYDVTNPDAPTKVTQAPIAEPRYADKRIVWGEKRCYTVRTAEAVNSFTVESDAPPAVCDVLVDTFAPAAPKGVAGIASEGAINLIWEPNAEKDFAGYVVLRAAAPSEDLQAITPPIQETSFKDAVQAGVAYTYAVRAIDRAGNASPASARVTETAR